MLKDRVVTVTAGDIPHGAWGLIPGGTVLRRGWFGCTALPLAGRVRWVQQSAGSPLSAQFQRRIPKGDWGQVTLAFHLSHGPTFTADLTWQAAQALLCALARSTPAPRLVRPWESPTPPSEKHQGGQGLPAERGPSPRHPMEIPRRFR